MADLISKNFFLGGLTETEVAEFELRILEDAKFAEEVSVFEESMVEDYLGGELSPEDKVRFETSYLVTDARFKNVEMVAHLYQIASELAESRADDSEAISGETGIISWIRSLSLGTRLVSAAGVLILVVTSIWLVFRPSTDDALIALQVQYEIVNQGQNNLDRGSNISELSLLSDNLRSTALPAEVSRVGLTNEVRIRLALGEFAETSTKYDVTILRDSIIVFRQDGIAPFSQSTIPEIRLILPRDIFEEGKYRIKLANDKSDAINYQFIVR